MSLRTADPDAAGPGRAGRLELSGAMLREGLAPIAAPDARILILGSMPGVASLDQQRYYAHPGNRFWSLLGAVLEHEFPVDPQQRLAQLHARKIALWDVVHRCRRSGSLDSAIERASVEPNNIEELLQRCPHIAHLFFNGAAAETLFRRHLQAQLAQSHPHLRYTRLPSSSPANASWSHQRKLAAWRTIADTLSNS